MSVITVKPWGREELRDVTSSYVVKSLVIDKGCRTSLQYHQEKEEFLVVIQGVVEVLLGEVTLRCSEGDSFKVDPGVVHRMTALESQAELLEVSTVELEDVIRVDDDYGRSDIGV